MGWQLYWQEKLQIIHIVSSNVDYILCLLSFNQFISDLFINQNGRVSKWFDAGRGYIHHSNNLHCYIFMVHITIIILTLVIDFY